MTAHTIMYFENLQDFYHTLPNISAKSQAPTTGDSGLGFANFGVAGTNWNYFEVCVAFVRL